MGNGSLKMQVNVPFAGYYSQPNYHTELETQLLFGEEVTVIEELPVLCKVQSGLYRTPGYVETKSLRQTLYSPTHRVMWPLVNVYLRADFKSPNLQTLAMNSLLSLRESTHTPEGIMLKFDGVGWIFANEVMLDSAAKDSDYVELLLRYVNLPYTWGGVYFPDCSGMVQQALRPRLKQCFRNCSDLIQLGMEADTDARTLMRGDMVFFMNGKSRHVVVMVDGVNCVHASILNRRVLVEPLVNVMRAQREAKYGTGEISAVRRFPWYQHERLKRLVA